MAQSKHGHSVQDRSPFVGATWPPGYFENTCGFMHDDEGDFVEPVDLVPEPVDSD